LALDTEFVSEKRYQPLLCLVQLAVPGGEPRLLDPLAGDDPGDLPAVLADPEVELLLHAGRQDVALLRRVWRTEVRNVFDTQVAAAFCGHGASVGYADLVRRVLGVNVPRSEGFTRWDARPLTDEQLAYARADVAELVALTDALADRLRRTGRLEWVREECRALEQASDERDPERLLRRLPRVTRLSERQAAVALELVRWREGRAAELDKPAGWLLPDHVVVEIARRRPGSRKVLGQVRGLPERTLHREHAGVLAAVERGDNAEPVALGSSQRVDLDKADSPLVALAQALVRHRSLEAQLAPELVATQGELQRVVAAVRDGGDPERERPLTGWRRELVGNELLDLLAGRRALTAAPERGLRVTEPD
jgi:ribonuclease D